MNLYSISICDPFPTVWVRYVVGNKQCDEEKLMISEWDSAVVESRIEKLKEMGKILRQIQIRTRLPGVKQLIGHGWDTPKLG